MQFQALYSETTVSVPAGAANVDTLIVAPPAGVEWRIVVVGVTTAAGISVGSVRLDGLNTGHVAGPSVSNNERKVKEYFGDAVRVISQVRATLSNTGTAAANVTVKLYGFSVT